MLDRLPVGVRRSLVGLGVTIGFVVLGELATTVLQVVVWRTRWRPGLDAIRRFNKRVRNPAMLKLAGERVTAIHHTGRRSGRAFVTPVWAERSAESFFIHLPYGTDVDWCRNVLAAGGCSLDHDGVCYDTAAPVIVPAAEAVPRLPTKLRRMDRLIGVDAYLRLDVIPAGTPARKAS